MKSPLSPARIRNCIEPLEARIAPATLFVGDHNFNNNLDTEYVEFNKQAGQSLFFVNTSLPSADPRVNPEGDLFAKNTDAISQVVDGPGVGTYYLRLNAGDVVFRFTDNGYKELVRVKSGSAIGFFTDYNHNLDYDDGEFTGLSLGPNASVLVSEKLFGDAVTNLNIGKLTNATPGGNRDDSLDVTGLVNFRQGIASLAVEGGSIFSGPNSVTGDPIKYGKVLSGGTIQQLTIGGFVEGVYAGTAAIGKTYDFFPDNPGRQDGSGKESFPGGGGVVNNILTPAGVPLLSPTGIVGASIENALILHVNESITAGNGGFGAHGGNLIGIQITQDTDGVKLQAGKGGDANIATRTFLAGAGGFIEQVYIAGNVDSTPNAAIQVLAGDGGVGLPTVKGGAGGFERGVFVGFELHDTLLTLSSDFLNDSVLLKAGHGGDGATGGNGGAIVFSRVRVNTNDAAGDEISVLGGKGGASISDTGIAGVGGVLSNLDIRNYQPRDQERDLLPLPSLLDSTLVLHGGDAGGTNGLGFGAKGGGLTNVTLQGFDIQALAGNGSDGRAGGEGGSIANLVITQDENQTIQTHVVTINAGKGGNATRRDAGAGGSMDGIVLEQVDVTSLSINSGVQGNGGVAAFGIGGAGGILRSLTVIDTDSGRGAAGEGLINFRGGDGGAGGARGGDGGSVIKASVSAINSNVVGTAGHGGNATRRGDGGVGGALNTVGVSTEGLIAAPDGAVIIPTDVLLQFPDTPIIAKTFVNASLAAGDGGNGVGIGGRGQVGGGVRFSDVNSVSNIKARGATEFDNGFLFPFADSPLVFAAPLFAIGGNAFIKAGKGGSGQSNFYDVRGVLQAGGAPAGGGSILVTGLFSESGAASMIAGDAGDKGNAPANGGIIIGVGDNVKLVGIRAFTSLTAQGGSGTHGGSGGSVSNLSYGSSSANDLRPTPKGDILIQGGNGSAEGLRAGTGGSLVLIDGAISSGIGSKTGFFAGHGGTVVATALPVTELVKGSAGVSEVQRIDLSDLVGVTSARFTLSIGGQETTFLGGARLSLPAIQAELTRLIPNQTPTASLDPSNHALLKITFAATGDQPEIIAKGYSGTIGGLGGSIARVSVSRGGGQDVEFKAAAGDGGSAGPLGRFGGAGGSISAVGIADIDDPQTIIRSFAGGDGGDARVIGGPGGNVTSVAVQDHDIGLRSGVAFGYNAAGGIFAGAGGLAALTDVHGKAGSVRDINANAIASIVAGKTLQPQSVEKVSEIYLNGSVQLVTRPSDGVGGVGSFILNSPFTLTFAGQTTSLIPANAIASVVADRLNELPAIISLVPVGSPLGTKGVSVSFGSNGSYIVTFNETGDQVLLVGEEAVPIVSSTSIPGQILTDTTNERLSGNVPVTVTSGVEGQRSLVVTEVVPGAPTFISSEQIRGDDVALPPVSEVQRLDLSRLLSFPTGRVTLTFDDQNTGLTNTTGNLGPVPTAVQVEQALNALPSIVAAGRVTVTTVSPEVFDVTFTRVGDMSPIVGQFLLPEQQQIVLGDIAGSATKQFTLSYDPGDAATSTTAPLAGNSTLTQIDAALEALDSIKALQGTVGDKVSVTSSQAGVLQITFNSIANKNAFVATGLVPESQNVDLGVLAGYPTSSFKLIYDSVSTGSIPVTADAATIDAALEGLSSIQALAGTAGDKVGVVKVPNSNLFTVTFKSNGDKTLLNASGARSEVQELNLTDIAAANGSELTLSVVHNVNVVETVKGKTGNSNPFTDTLQQGEFALSIPETTRGTAQTSEIQTINLGAVAGKPTATFALSFGPDTTANLPSSATAAQVETALNGLQGVTDAGGLTVVGNVGGPFTVTFTMKGDEASLTGIGDVPEVQRVELSTLRTVTGGQFTLTYGADTTPPLDRNAPATGLNSVDAALELLPSIIALNGAPGNKVTVAVGTGGYEYQVTFNGNGDKDQITIVGGGTGDREVQTLNITPLLSFGGGANSTFNLMFGPDVTPSLSGNTTAAMIDAALEALPSIRALGPPVPIPDNVTVTSVSPGIFQIAFNTFGDQDLISGLSKVGQSPTTIGTTARLPGNATPTQIMAAINLVSQTPITVSAGSAAGTVDFTFGENADQPPISATEFFHETQVVDIFSVGQFQAQFGADKTPRLAPGSTAQQVDAALEALPSIQALAGPVGDKVMVTPGTNSSYVVLFRADGDIDPLSGTQFLNFAVTNEINRFNQNGSPTSAEKQMLTYFPKGAFNPAFFNLSKVDPLNPPTNPSANLVGSISDINELDANVFHYIHNNVLRSSADGPFVLGDQPIDGLIMAKVLDQSTLNFTPEARYIAAVFYDNDNII